MKHLTPLLEGRTAPTTRAGQAAINLLGSFGHLYGAIQYLRTEMYRRNLLSSYRPPCQVISVGNLSAGGTGKTPMVLWLARQLSQRLRRKEGGVAIVSRGYGTAQTPFSTTPKGITIVATPEGIHLTPPQAADEAALLAYNLPGVVVLTGADRADLIHFAIEQYGSELILMDDGFQHLRVKRDLDLVLVDAQHPFGNGYLLPGGILREQPSALQRCDALLITRAHDRIATEKTKALLQQTVPGKPILCADHRPQAWMRLDTTQPIALSMLENRPVLAFCGIARPDSFAKLLGNTKIQTAGLHIFPDHFPFTKHTLENLIQKARSVQAQALVCTEKDAVKISKAWLTTDLGTFPLFFLRMELVFLEDATWIKNRMDCIANQLNGL